MALSVSQELLQVLQGDFLPALLLCGAVLADEGVGVAGHGEGLDDLIVQVFHLTDDQKALAGDYAQNLSLFLSDGSIQHTEYTGGWPGAPLLVSPPKISPGSMRTNSTA